MIGRGVGIEIEGLRKSYNGVPVLADLVLHIEAGEIMVILGGSGEGKSARSEEQETVSPSRRSTARHSQSCNGNALKTYTISLP